MNPNKKKRGHYLGTELGGKWWRRYTRDGFLSRGNGEYWMDTSALFFRRYLTDTPIVIFFDDVLEVKTGKWHSGRWAFGAPVVKVVWKKGDNMLSSGFVFSRDSSETEALVQKMLSLAGQETVNRAPPAHAADTVKRRD